MNYIEKEEATNTAKISGKICSEIENSHQVDGEKFLEFFVEVERLSKIKDVIPVTISERILAGKQLKKDDFVQLEGEYRSYNKLVSEKSKLILHFFAKNLSFDKAEDANEVKLTGFICKEPVYRKTPFEREICDILLAVNRANYHKSDYIPCILWGRNARFISSQGVGCKVQIVGRIQSRQYTKALENGDVSTMTAYEVSCQSVSILNNVSSFKPAAVDETKTNELV